MDGKVITFARHISDMILSSLLSACRYLLLWAIKKAWVHCVLFLPLKETQNQPHKIKRSLRSFFSSGGSMWTNGDGQSIWTINRRSGMHTLKRINVCVCKDIFHWLPAFGWRGITLRVLPPSFKREKAKTWTEWELFLCLYLMYWEKRANINISDTLLQVGEQKKARKHVVKLLSWLIWMCNGESHKKEVELCREQNMAFWEGIK